MNLDITVDCLHGLSLSRILFTDYPGIPVQWIADQVRNDEKGACHTGLDPVSIVM